MAFINTLDVRVSWAFQIALRLAHLTRHVEALTSDLQSVAA